MPAASWFTIALFALGIALLVVYYRTGKLIRCVLFTAFTGALTLGAVWLIGRFAPVAVAVTPFSLLVSTILGAPGVIAMLLLGLI